MNEADAVVKRRAMDRERHRLVAEQKKRMGGERRFQHVRNAIVKRMKGDKHV